MSLIVLLQSKSTSEPTDSQPLPFTIEISEKLNLRGPPRHSNPLNKTTKYIHYEEKHIGQDINNTVSSLPHLSILKLSISTEWSG